MRDHTKLRAFKLADEVAVLIYRATRGFPKEEIYGLTSQMRRAAVSVLPTSLRGVHVRARSNTFAFLKLLSVPCSIRFGHALGLYG